MKPAERLLTKMVSLLCLIVLVELICLSSSKIIQVKASVKTQGGEGDDPDSRMDSERADRRDKKGGKGKVHQYFLVTFLYASDDESRSFVFALSVNDYTNMASVLKCGQVIFHRQGLRGSSSKGSFWKQ